MIEPRIQLVILSALWFALTSCQSQINSVVNQEFPYCSKVQTFSPAVQVTGRALYQRRSFSGSGLGGVDATPYPIRFAEIQVYANNLLIQCGETDGSGNFSVFVPQHNRNLELRVNSRADNTNVRVSVLNNPSDLTPHYVKREFNPMNTASLGDLVAPAKGTLEGGAFNIYDQILKANEFLRNQTDACNTLISLCVPFTTAPKARVYWEAGVNPGIYAGISTPVSYYAKSTSQLYILGGVNGDTDTADTDHFDNSVIIHEYGHFIEDIYSKSDSPGGSHDANSVIDPRLAWGEGWANFFSLAVTGDPVYRDTYGNSDGATGTYFLHNLETNIPAKDIPTTSGEGNFREFSITRALWDSIDPHPISAEGTNEAGDDDATASFREFWTVFTSSSLFKSSARAFRNYGLFMELHSALTGSTNLSTIHTAEFQKANQEDYAAKYTAGGACTYTLTTNWSGEDGSFENSNQFRSNDFFQWEHAGGPLTINLNRQSAPPGDLDLYLYKENYIFGDETTMTARSADGASDDGGTEEISADLPAGKYMINVMIYPESDPFPASSSATYKLLVNGAELCP